MHIWIIQWSLNPQSKTAIGIDACIKKIAATQYSYTLFDLREHAVPFCDGRSLQWYGKEVEVLFDNLNDCTHFIIGMPVYQYTFSWALKNFLDLFYRALQWKPFGIIENSGSVRSYIAAGDLIKSLFFEVWAFPVPPVVHTWAEDFEGEVIKNQRVFEKMDSLLANLIKIGK